MHNLLFNQRTLNLSSTQRTINSMRVISFMERLEIFEAISVEHVIAVGDDFTCVWVGHWKLFKAKSATVLQYFSFLYWLDFGLGSTYIVNLDFAVLTFKY